VSVRGSCGQPEIWSAGSKHHVTALKESSQRSGLIAGSSPPKSNDVSGRPRFILQPLSRPGQCPQTSPHRPTTPATARQRTPASTAGQPRKFSRRHRVPPATSGLILQWQLIIRGARGAHRRKSGPAACIRRRIGVALSGSGFHGGRVPPTPLRHPDGANHRLKTSCDHRQLTVLS